MVGKRPLALQPVLFSIVFGKERLVRSPARYRKLKIWLPNSPGGAKSWQVGCSAFALRRRFGQTKVGFVWPLPGKVGADVFGQAGWQRQRFWRLRRRLVGQVLGNCGALVGERPFCVVEVLEGKRPFLHRSCPARLAQTFSAKRFGNGGGFVVCGAGWLAKALGIASGPVGKGRLYSTRVMEGERPFSGKLLGNSQRHFPQSQSASA